MGEINRVFTHIDGFFSAGGAEHIDALVEVLDAHIRGAKRGFNERELDNDALAELIDGVVAKIDELVASPPKGLKELQKAFREVAVDAMAVRRAVLPLDDPKSPRKKLDPREALFDDDDQYSFAIYDTLADEVSQILPEIHQIACEVAWDKDTPTE